MKRHFAIWSIFGVALGAFISLRATIIPTTRLPPTGVWVNPGAYLMPHDPVTGLIKSTVEIPYNGGTPLANTSTHTQIESAITAAAALWDGVVGDEVIVNLATGTFSSQGATVRVYTDSHVILRGAGMFNTVLPLGVKNGSSPYLTGAGGWGSGTAISSGATKGSTSIVVGNVSTGQIINGQPMHIQSANAGGVYGFGNGNTTSTPTYNSAGILRDGAAVAGQDVIVTGIAGTTVTFTPALNFDLTGGTAYGWNGTYGSTFFGIENMTVKNTGAGNIAYWMEGDRQCWMQNVRATDWGGINQWLRCIECELNYCLIDDPTVFKTNEGYALDSDHMTNCLIVNSIFFNCQNMLTINGSSSGNAIEGNLFYGENYHDGAGNPTNVLLGGASDNHMPFPQLNLFENNCMDGVFADYWYGPSANGTIARNRILGVDPVTTGNLICVNLAAHQWNYNVVGNVLGSTGTSTDFTAALLGVTIHYTNTSSLTWTYGITDQTNFSTPHEFRLGYPNLGNNASTTWKSNPNNSSELGYGDTDVQAQASAPAGDGNYTLIHHNHLHSSGAVQNDSSIGDTTVPNSYLYATKPAYMRGLAWPAYDADTGEAANVVAELEKIPAGYRFVTGVDPTADVDTTPPTPNPSTGSASVTGATTVDVTADIATDADSPPVQYRFSKDAGSTWTSYQSGVVYHWTGLMAATLYHFKVQAEDSATSPNVTTSSSNIDATTNSVPTAGKSRGGRVVSGKSF